MKNLLLLIPFLFLACSKESDKKLTKCDLDGVWYLVTKIDGVEVENTNDYSHMASIVEAITETSNVKLSSYYVQFSANKVEDSFGANNGTLTVSSDCHTLKMEQPGITWEIPYNENGYMLMKGSTSANYRIFAN